MVYHDLQRENSSETLGTLHAGNARDHAEPTRSYYAPLNLSKIQTPLNEKLSFFEERSKRFFGSSSKMMVSEERTIRSSRISFVKPYTKTISNIFLARVQNRYQFLFER